MTLNKKAVIEKNCIALRNHQGNAKPFPNQNFSIENSLKETMSLNMLHMIT